MPPETRHVVWAFAGNLVVGFGAGTATLAAFAPSLPVFGDPHFVSRVAVVSIGFAFFFAGYHITQAGTYRDPDEPVLVSLLPTSVLTRGGVASDGSGVKTSDTGKFTPIAAVRGTFVVLGVVGLGAGMRLFAITIESWDPMMGVLTGIVCIGGYIAGHIGLNWVLL